MRDIKDYADNYNVPNFEDYQIKYRRKKILEILNKYKPREIIEIGCGMEPLFKFIDKSAYDRYMVIEPSEVFCKRAIELAENNSKITIINDYFGTGSLELDNEWNLVVCSSLLHEIEEPENFLNEIKKLCNKETIVHINVPNANSFHRLLAQCMGLISDVHEKSERNKIYQQNSVFDLDALCEIMREIGFSIIDKGSYFIKPFTHTQMYKLMSEKIIDEKVLEGLYNVSKYMPDYGSEIFVNARI